MSDFDVRSITADPVTQITFAERMSGATNIAYLLAAFTGGGVKIKDGTSEYVVIRDKAHAANLRKALDKAEELGWLE